MAAQLFRAGNLGSIAIKQDYPGGVIELSVGKLLVSDAEHPGYRAQVSGLWPHHRLSSVVDIVAFHRFA